MESEPRCVICQQAFQSPVSLPVCQHTFCQACLQQWLTLSNTCPICRQVNRQRIRCSLCDQWRDQLRTGCPSHGSPDTLPIAFDRQRLAQVRPIITGLVDEWRSIRRKLVQLQDSFDELHNALGDLLHSIKNATD